jgi:CheY-like chemotaxis protein
MMHLPRRAGKPVETLAPAAVARPNARGETILVVEDEPDVLELTATLLEMRGYTVLAAPSTREALRLAREHPGEIHLLLTDVLMPEMNGQDLARQVVALRPQVRILFMSGYTADIIAEQGELAAEWHFIQKPFATHVLATKVRQVLDAGQE